MTRHGPGRATGSKRHPLSQVTFPSDDTRSQTRESTDTSFHSFQAHQSAPIATDTQAEGHQEVKAVFEVAMAAIQDTARAHTGEQLEANLLCLLSGMTGVPFDLPSLTCEGSQRSARSKSAFLASVLTEAGSLEGAEWGAYLGYIHEVVGGMLGWLTAAEEEFLFD